MPTKKPSWKEQLVVLLLMLLVGTLAFLLRYYWDKWYIPWILSRSAE